MLIKTWRPTHLVYNYLQTCELHKMKCLWFNNNNNHNNDDGFICLKTICQFLHNLSAAKQ